MQQRKRNQEAWEVKWANGRAVTYFERESDARYFEKSVRNTGNEWTSTKLAKVLPGAKVRSTRVRVAQQREHTYHGTTYDVPGAPLPAFLEPFVFPKYITDDVREQSLLQLVPDIAETVVSLAGSGSWQEIFDNVLVDMGADEFSEVRRRVFQMLPPEIQSEVVW